MQDETQEFDGRNEPDVDADKLIAWLDDLEEGKKAISEATGALRSQIKAILEETGWHKSALAMIRQIDDMSETKRADFLRSFDPLYRAMMDAKWETEMEDLLADQNEGEEAA